MGSSLGVAVSPLLAPEGQSVTAGFCHRQSPRSLLHGARRALHGRQEWRPGHSLPACPNLALACLPEAERKRPFSLAGVCTAKCRPSCGGLIGLFKWGIATLKPLNCSVLLQTEKADRRQNFVSLALRKRYSYLTEPGMSELLLPKY